MKGTILCIAAGFASVLCLVLIEQVFAPLSFHGAWLLAAFGMLSLIFLGFSVAIPVIGWLDRWLDNRFYRKMDTGILQGNNGENFD